MSAPPRANFGAFYQSPYAIELQRGPSMQCAWPALEAEYMAARLLEHRTLVRFACALAVALSILRAVEQSIAGVVDVLFVSIAGFALVLSAILVVLAWSPLYARWYLPVATIALPARNIVVSVPIAAVAAVGQTEILAMLPLLIIGPFFFLGLPFRTGLITVVATAVAFLVSAFVFDLPFTLLVRCAIFTTVSVAACALAARHIETRARTSFLQGRLIAELADHDALTGTKNRRVLDEHLSRLWQQASDDHRSIAVLLIDVDHFKAYNDLYGHQAGDQALCQIARTVQQNVSRPLDLVARYGGEEFAVILYDVNAVYARDMAERMRLDVANLAIAHRGSRCASVVTISVGVAAIQPSVDRRARGALQLADEALYTAKSGGRNRVEVMDEGEYRTLVTGVFACQRSSQAPGS